MAELFSKWGATSARQKNYIKFLRLELANVTSQALKCCVIIYTPYEGLNYTVLDKITPQWKRSGEIQIGFYRDDPGQQRHSCSSYDLFWLNATVRRLRHWNFQLLSFWLALSVLCDQGRRKIHFQRPLIVYDVMRSTVAGPFCKIAHRLHLVDVNRYIRFAHPKITGWT